VNFIFLGTSTVKLNKLLTVNVIWTMAETSGGSFVSLNLDNMLDEGEMFWDEVVNGNKQKVRQRSDSEESIETVIMAKKTKTDGNGSLRPQVDVWKVILVFDQKGGPDLHPIHITKAIEKEIGKINHAHFMGNGRILIFANSKEQQNKILKKTTLNKLKVTSHIPGAASKVRGVISGIPTSVSIEEIMESLEDYDVCEAKRLTKGKDKIESLSILLGFKKELPSRVQMGYMSYSVREYIPPPLRCFNCQRYGHAASQCRGKIRCAKCGGEHKYGECEQDAVLKCCNCGGNHSAAYGGCEKHKEAKEVQKCKMIHKVSYAEAVKKIEMEKKGASLIVPHNRSVVLKVTPNNQNTVNPKRKCPKK